MFTSFPVSADSPYQKNRISASVTSFFLDDARKDASPARPVACGSASPDPGPVFGAIPLIV